MAIRSVMESPTSTETEVISRMRSQYGCGAVDFAGATNALYERHLMFDDVVDLAAAGARERFEALAHSVRDILSQRWIKTEDAYAREKPKRVYYLSMEFLIGRSLANNVTNLLLDPIVRQAIKMKDLDWVSLLEQEPDAGLGNGGLGRLAACFLDSMATCNCQPWVTACATSTECSSRPFVTAGNRNSRITGCAIRTRGRLLAWTRLSQVKLNCSFQMREGSLRAVPGKPSTLIGVPFDRPVVGYGGKTINTLRLWAAAAPDYFDFQAFSHGDFVGAVAETSRGRIAHPSALSRRFHQHGAGAALRAGILPRRLLAGRPRTAIPRKQRRLELASRESRHPAQRHASVDGRRRS